MAGFYARHYPVSWHCDGGANLLSIAVSPSLHHKSPYLLIYIQLLTERAESALALQLMVQRPVPKAAAHNDCGPPLGAMAGLGLRTLG